MVQNNTTAAKISLPGVWRLLCPRNQVWQPGARLWSLGDRRGRQEWGLLAARVCAGLSNTTGDLQRITTLTGQRRTVRRKRTESHGNCITPVQKRSLQLQAG